MNGNGLQKDGAGAGRNAGFELLRIALSFEVVLDHYWLVGVGDASGVLWVLKYMRHLAVPCFMALSFYLSAAKFVSSDWSWYGRRLSRLIVPFWFWAVAAYVLLKIVSLAGGCEAVSLSDLLWQMALGSSPKLNRPLWFQSDLIILTIILFPLVRAVGRRWLWALLGVFALGSVTLQYTGVSANFFSDFPWESRYTLFRLTPMLLYVAVGLAAGLLLRARMEALGLGGRLVLMALSLWAVVLFIALGPTVLPAAPGPRLGYAGLELVAVAVPMLAFFGSLPFDRLPSAVSRVIESFSRYAIGIYCLHYILGIPMFRYVFPRIGLGQETIPACVLLWFLSWGVCRLISLIPLEFCKRIVR